MLPGAAAVQRSTEEGAEFALEAVSTGGHFRELREQAVSASDAFPDALQSRAAQSALRRALEQAADGQPSFLDYARPAADAGRTAIGAWQQLTLNAAASGIAEARAAGDIDRANRLLAGLHDSAGGVFGDDAPAVQRILQRLETLPPGKRGEAILRQTFQDEPLQASGIDPQGHLSKALRGFALVTSIPGHLQSIGDYGVSIRPRPAAPRR